MLSMQQNLINCLYEHYRLILIYLISARMVLGTFPRPELLAKYNLMDKYQTLCTAIKQGNLSGYQYHLERHMPTLLREGTYIMLKERVKVVIWRCLFRRVWVSLVSEVVKVYNSTDRLRTFIRIVTFCYESLAKHLYCLLINAWLRYNFHLVTKLMICWT